MASDEGRARFLTQAKPLVSKVEAPALAAMLRHRVAELAHLDGAELDRLVPAPAPFAPTSSRRPPAPPPRAARKPFRAPDAQLLGRLLARPEIALDVPDEVLDRGTPTGAALAEAVAFFRRQPGATLGQASAYFEGSEHHPAFAEALNEPLLNQAESPDFDLVAEGRELVERMLSERRARRSSELLRLVENGTATPEQKAEYDALFLRLATSKQGNASPGERSKL
jgi:DNA primase